MVISDKETEIEEKQEIIFNLEQEKKNKNLALWIGLPVSFIIGGIVTGLIVGRSMK